MEELGKLSKLVEALSKAQSVIQGAVKDSENPYFKSSYADLASVWEACRKPLTDNGLAIIQLTKMIEGKLYLETVLAHSSGESVSSIYPINPMRQEKERGDETSSSKAKWVPSEDPQALGSALTYARRYALAAIVGVAPEDDDGEGAVGRGKEKDKQPEERKGPGQETKRVKTVVLKIEPKEKVVEGGRISKWFIIHTEGEGIYRTFSESLKKVAEEAQSRMAFVEIDYTSGKYGNEIKAINLVPDEVDKGGK